MEDSEHLPRKLAAILYADVAGYSRLTGVDEDATHRRLTEYLDVMAATIEQHRGRVMHYAGDAVLAMFEAAVDALSCAIEIQNELDTRNAKMPDERKVQFRIGVNLGDVIVDRGDIYGEGVNVAARLEGLAAPGEICISDSVRSAIGRKLALDYEFMGEQPVRNIAEPVRAYRVVASAGLVASSPTRDQPVSARPGKPSIAVLPFANMSADKEQEYFSDGITEDIITELSRFRDLSVVARNSSFAFKGKSVPISEVGSKLGAQYVVEGSVRKLGSRIRIAAQLINVATGDHIWADRYDRAQEDIFVVQDEVARTVTATLTGRVEQVRRERARHKPTSSMEAYDCLLRGREHFFRWTPADQAVAKEMFTKAIRLDPHFAAAYVGLAETYSQEWHSGWSEAPEHSFARFCEYAEKSVALDETDSRTLAIMGMACLFRREFDQAHSHLDRALRLNPIDTRTLARLARYHMLIGKPERAIQRAHEAASIDPYGKFDWYLGQAHYVARRYDEAISAFKSVRDPVAVVRAWTAASYAQAGLKTEAKQTAEACISATQSELGARADAHNWLEFLGQRWPFKHEADAEHLGEGLRKAGLGEHAGRPR